MARPPAKPDPFEEIAAALPTFEDDAEALLTLRQQAMLDPPKNCPMRLGPEPEGPADTTGLVDPGKWIDAGYVDRKTGLPSNCPVVALGQDGETFYFLNTLGEVHTLAPNAGKGHIDALFAGRPRYLNWAWPRWSMPRKKGENAVVTNWEAETARQDLFAACAFKGSFELGDRVRGRGAWPADDGGLIYHAGDAVWIDGRWRPPGEHGGYIYPGRPRIGRPSDRYEPAGEGSPGDLLLQALQSWNWDRAELDPRLALGWLVTAMLGGALDQRPVAYVVGQEGVGKSTLQALLRLVLNGALLSTANTTQAGIYQKVRQDSIAVMVDELEAKEDTRTTDKILELARISFSGDKMQRGGKDGVGVEFALRSSFLFSMIALPAMDAQDASRGAIFHMRERPKAEAGRPQVDVLRELGLREGKKAQAVGRHLLKRAFDWFPRWRELRDAFREALLKAGHEDRSADTFGALAAGCHVALHDDMPDAAMLDQWAAWLDPGKLNETANRQKSWRRCFAHIFDAPAEPFRTRHHKTLGAVLAAWRENPATQSDVDDYARQIGLSISFRKGDTDQRFETARLFIPSNSASLHALFAGTPWAGRLGAPGPWAGVLRQMPEQLWDYGKSDKGLPSKVAGIMIELAAALEV